MPNLFCVCKNKHKKGKVGKAKKGKGVVKVFQELNISNISISVENWALLLD